ncbi:MAG: hypothetical protein ACK537_05280 [Pseudomonadota bacterium]
MAWALGGCASAPPPAMAVIAVELEGMPADWPPTLACRASTPAGSWEFTAPGTVRVRATGAPLRMECTALRDRKIAGIIHALRGGSFAGYPGSVRIRIEDAEGPR